MNRFGSCLNNKYLAGFPVFCPFNIHRLLVVVFYSERPMCKLYNFHIIQHKPFLFFFRSVCVNHRITIFCIAFRLINQCFSFGSQHSAYNGIFSFSQSGFKNEKFIRRYRSLYDVFTKSPHATQMNDIPESGLGFECKNDTGRSLICTHHFLNTHRNFHVVVFKSVFLPVFDCPVGVKRSKTFFHRVEQCRFTLYIQITFVLAGKTGVWQIFGRSAAPYGNFCFHFSTQFCIRPYYL